MNKSMDVSLKWMTESDKHCGALSHKTRKQQLRKFFITRTPVLQTVSGQKH